MFKKLTIICLAAFFTSTATANDCITEIFETIVGQWSVEGYNFGADGKLTDVRNETMITRTDETTFKIEGENLNTGQPFSSQFDLQNSDLVVQYPSSGEDAITYRVQTCIGPRQNGSFVYVDHFTNTDPASGLEFEVERRARFQPNLIHWTFAARPAGSDSLFVPYGAQLQRRQE